MGDDGNTVTGRGSVANDGVFAYRSVVRPRDEEPSASTESSETKRKRMRGALVSAIEQKWEDRITGSNMVSSAEGSVFMRSRGEDYSFRITRKDEQDFIIEIVCPWPREKQGDQILISAESLRNILACNNCHTQALNRLFPETS